MLLMSTACAPRYVDYFPYHDDGCAKPKVAIMPILDSCSVQLPWDVKEELSQSIFYSLMENGQLYVLEKEELGDVACQRSCEDVFSQDYSYVSDFDCADFIVAMELIDHSMHSCNPNGPKSKGETPQSFQPGNNLLTMAVRVKVIDVRRREPKVVLYEIIKCDYMATPMALNCDYQQQGWGSSSYAYTPWGAIHARLVDKVVARLEEVLQCAR